MQQEIEAKFLNQNHEEIRNKLQNLGAIRVYENKVMRRTVFDFPDRSLKQKGAWVRLREELSGAVEITLKQSKDNCSIYGVFESAVEVKDYEAAKAFLTALGLEVKGEQESKRELWQLDEVEIMLDEWPWVLPFVEIEATDEIKIKNTAEALGLKWADAKFGGVTPVYTAEYVLSEEEFIGLELSMKFSEPVPAELIKR